nr:MAG TPA: Protein transport protein Sec24B coat protein, vesicle transport.8A [Caudoviricetes sp.]
MGLIDADKIQWKSYPNDYGETNDDYVEKCDIDNMPTVDAVPVVRCKNCRSYNKPKTGWCEVHLDREHPDDFCSYGKRKDGGAE